MLRVNYAECRKLVNYAECHYAECRYAECRGTLTGASCNTDCH
jgi:hypothetical protein